MASNNFVSLRYNDIITPVLNAGKVAPEGEFFDHAPLKAEWGEVVIRDLIMPDFRIISFSSDVLVNLQLRREHVSEATTVDTCVMLNGSINSSFFGLKKRMVLKRGEHNFIYKPQTADDHFIPAQEGLHLIHISFNLPYYLELLCERERWSASLREKILRKEVVSGAVESLALTQSMKSLVLEMLNCPLKGNLRSLVMEAKILEFAALQLNQSMNGSNPKTTGLTAKDSEAFYALKNFLDQTFTDAHSLKTLSRTFGLNEFKLKRGFKEIFGTTIFDYLHELKMNHAKQLLLDSGLLVNEVSGKVGYKNPNHFSTAFKKKFGLNPACLKN